QLSLLLITLMAGDIQPNPEPQKWFCAVCKDELNSHTYSVQCNQCYQWLHMTRCTNLLKSTNWTTKFVGNCCTKKAPANKSTTTG
ncbi:hypothetical protein, partial [Streptomyces sp. IBSBF 2390]|uniref:hypothetical protein n=1 Tax=Streptomyces sp. IBSBF 2390 TaxID=2903533 RepID=UPI002FDC7532